MPMTCPRGLARQFWLPLRIRKDMTRERDILERVNRKCMMLRTRWPSGCPSLRVGQRHAVGRRYRSTRSPALFTIPQLASPSDFTAWTEDAQSRAVTLRAIVLSENSPLAPPKSLDLISDTLCSVADVAECARLIAPKSSGWGAHAHAARMRIQATMEAFNSDHAIYSVRLDCFTL